MIPNPLYDPSARQVVVCDCGCGREIPLKPYQSMKWSIYSVSCIRCGLFGLISKFHLASGVQCPQCDQKLMILKRHPFSEYMVHLLCEQNMPLFKYVHGDGVEKLE